MRSLSGLVMSMLEESLDSIDGVLDVGILVVAHFENPLREDALLFLRDVLSWKNRLIIPLTGFLGAYHILTRYLRVSRVEAKISLSDTLKVGSPSFYKDVTEDVVGKALDYAVSYKIESWDGYLIAIARKFNTRNIYTLDTKLKKIRDIIAVNPLPEEKTKQYHQFLKNRSSS